MNSGTKISHDQSDGKAKLLGKKGSAHDPKHFMACVV